MLHEHIRLVDNDVIAGKGLVAINRIRAGEVVTKLEPHQPLYLISEVLTWSEEAQDNLLHYAYQCSETHIVNEQGSEKYMNHACDPNTWWSDDETMIARRDILAGEEITYDYATTEVTIPYTMVCHCGSAACRKIITHLDYQDVAWQKKFSKHLPRHTLNAIASYHKQSSG